MGQLKKYTEMNLNEIAIKYAGHVLCSYAGFD